MDVRIRGAKVVKAKGHTYLYHRKTGQRLKAHHLDGAAIGEEVKALDRKHADKHARPGTLGGVVTAYKASTFWTDLRPKTRLSYERALTVLDQLRDMPLANITKGFVAGFRDKSVKRRGRWLTNYTITVLSILCEFAMERELIDINPADKVRRLRRSPDAPRANRPWSVSECRAVLDAAPPYLRVAIGLSMFAGLRKGDVLSAWKVMIGDGVIRVRTAKRDVPVAVPIHPTLANILSMAPAHRARTIAANSYGESWTETGFNSTFRKLIARLEKAEKVEKGLTFHGLRHTVGTRLREAGADDGTIADILGQKTTAMARHYSKSADLPANAQALVLALDPTGQNTSRTEMENSVGKNGKPTREKNKKIGSKSLI